jgi:predicted nucleic acid-binding protein
MRTAVDTSALYAILAAEPTAAAWMNCLVKARREGQLIICDIVFAELAPAFHTKRELESALAKLGVSYEAIDPPAAFAAGRAFLDYRAQGGPRERLIPDFLIAAHASMQADRLAAADRGYVRTYFKSLKLLTV